ncbi:MAG: hypothetical protein OEX23_07130 [Betaproteobacteria bacterium]|jgi:hypothetical protein|nr:hypothetical protein [Betaproteobacteria bacterium]
MGKQTAVIIERRYVDDEGKVVVSRHPQWKVDCWDAVEGLPDDEARWWALEKLLWGMWERGVEVGRVTEFAKARYAERDERSRAEAALETGES